MSDLSLPPDYAPALSEAAKHEVNIVKLAREIAMEMRDLSAILEHHGVSAREFEVLKRNPYFDRVLASEIEAWQSAVNTGERVRLKAAAAMEEFMPVLYERMVNPKEDLLKTVKGAELLTKLASLGESDKSADAAGKVVITINMGSDSKLQAVKELPAKVIDHVPSIDVADELQQGLFEASLDGNLNPV